MVKLCLLALDYKVAWVSNLMVKISFTLQESGNAMSNPPLLIQAVGSEEEEMIPQPSLSLAWPLLFAQT